MCYNRAMENTSTPPNPPSDRGRILEGLNPEQKKAVTHKKGPLLIVAGAGTGKTTVITRRIAHLVMNEGVKANEILALTFTNKAAEEMIERVDKSLPMGYVDLWVSTFHTFAQKILEEHGMDIGISSSVELLDDTGLWLLVRQNLDKFNLDYYRPRNNPTKFIKAMLTHFSRLKDEEITPEQYLEYAEELKASHDDMESSGGRSRDPSTSSAGADSAQDDKRRIIEIANAYHVYQELLHENNKMDFGDLINYCLKLFRERPNVLAHYQKQFKYILVDEFQDTNWAQFDLVKMLALPENNITVVADDDQSIYRFRGASMSNVIQFSKDYKDAEKVSLIQNYRSGQVILDVSYDFIQLNNPNRLEAASLPAKEGTEGRSRDSKKDITPSSSPLAGGEISKKLISNTKDPATIAHLQATDAQTESRVVAETILELKKNDKDATWNDFAILVRANSQTDEFEEALSLSQIPHQNYSAAGLYKTSLIMNILSFFRVINDFHESRDLFRLLNLPFLKIAAENIVKMNHHTGRKRIPLYEAVKSPQIAGVSSDVSVKNIEQLNTWIQEYAEKSKSEKPSRLLLDWLNKGYMEYLNGLDEADSQEQFRYLKIFYDHIREIESIVADARVLDIVNILQQEIDSGDAGSLPVDSEAGPEMVKIMTIHNAKGLEFKYVFVTNLVDRRFPTIERKEAIQIPDELVKEVLPEGEVHIEEERRLFYVAMTRAKQGLFFTSAENYGGVQKKKVSRFLNELEEVHKNFKISKDILGTDAKTVLTQTHGKFTKDFYLYIPKRFSFTQLKIFDECPFAYKMQFLLGVPLPGKFVFSYGTTMHSTLQQFMQMVSGKQRSIQTDLFGTAAQAQESNAEAGLSVKIDELLDMFEKNWLDDWYDSKEQMDEYKKKGKQALKIFYENLQKGPIPNVKALERGFNIKMGDNTITGKMDRVDSVGDGEVEIVDYKTGNPPKNDKLTTQDKRQLLIYQIGAEEVLHEKVKNLTYYYVDSAKPLPFIGTEEEKQEVKLWITETIDAIHNSDFTQKSQQHFCDYCEFFTDLG